MELTSQAIVGIVGVVVNLPPTLIVMWKCWYCGQRSRNGGQPSCKHGSTTTYTEILELTINF